MLLFVMFTGCAVPQTTAYRDFYSHLRQPIPKRHPNWTSSNFVILYVEARHLDYTDNLSFFKTLTKHPSDGSKNRDVGHAWIYIQGELEGRLYVVEGGHSGERGLNQAKYFDGIMNYIDFGYCNPTTEQLTCPRYEANPVKYLWDTQKDGYFEIGSGGHKPTYAVKVDMTEGQFSKILSFVYAYDYSCYSLVENQCCSFVQQVAALAGLQLEVQVSIPVAPFIIFKGDHIRFWEDPYYSVLTISSPDALERSMMQAVRDGKAEQIYP